MPKEFYIDSKICPNCGEDASDLHHCICSIQDLGGTVIQRNDFRVKRPYQSEFPQTIICPCGCDQFIVGKGSYFTAIRCKECGFEYVVHEG